MAPKKYYAVRKGRQTGIFNTWDECLNQVKGYPGNEYKSFASWEEANNYLLQIVGHAHFSSDEKNVAENLTNQSSSTSSLKTATDVFSEHLEKNESSSKKKRTSSMSSTVVEENNNAKNRKGPYFIEFDGASKGNPGRAGAGAVVRYPDGSLFCALKEGVGMATNNVAEYRALIRGLKFCLENGIDSVHVQGDSNLVCMQVQEKWRTKNENIMALSREAKELKSRFREFQIRHVLREYNSTADSLANEAIFLRDGECICNREIP